MKWNKSFNGIITLLVVFIALSFTGNGIAKVHNYHQSIRRNTPGAARELFETDFFETYKKYYDLNERECVIANSTIQSISQDQRDILFDIIYDHLINIEENITEKQAYMLQMFKDSDENQYLPITFSKNDILDAMETPPGEIIERMLTDESIRPIPDFFEFLTSEFEKIYNMNKVRYKEKYNEAMMIYNSIDFDEYVK